MRTESEIARIVAELYSGIALLFPQSSVEAILFGSYARGDAGSGSDIDVLLLVDASREDISAQNWQVGNLAAELLINYDVVVSPIVENKNYFNSNLDVLPFFRNIDQEGIKLVACTLPSLESIDEEFDHINDHRHAWNTWKQCRQMLLQRK